MPFPFDNVQTIGILSGLNIARNPQTLPIVPKQDKQDPPRNPSIEDWAGNGKFPSIFPDLRFTIRDPLIGLDPRDYGYDPDGPDVLPEQDYTDPNPKQPTKEIVKDIRAGSQYIPDSDPYKLKNVKFYLGNGQVMEGALLELMIKLIKMVKDRIDQKRKELEKLRDCFELSLTGDPSSDVDKESVLGCLLNSPWDGYTFVVGNEYQGMQFDAFTAVNKNGNLFTVLVPSQLDISIQSKNLLTPEEQEEYLASVILHELVHKCLRAKGDINEASEFEAYYFQQLLFGDKYSSNDQQTKDYINSKSGEYNDTNNYPHHNNADWNYGKYFAWDKDGNVYCLGGDGNWKMLDEPFK